MSDITEAIQRRLTPDAAKAFLIKKLVEVIAAAAKKLGQEIEKYQERSLCARQWKENKEDPNPMYPIHGGKMGKRQCEKRKGYRNNRQLINFIDKVFFEDGALQLEKRGIRK